MNTSKTTAVKKNEDSHCFYVHRITTNVRKEQRKLKVF